MPDYQTLKHYDALKAASRADAGEPGQPSTYGYLPGELKPPVTNPYKPVELKQPTAAATIYIYIDHTYNLVISDFM